MNRVTRPVVAALLLCSACVVGIIGPTSDGGADGGSGGGAGGNGGAGGGGGGGGGGGSDIDAGPVDAGTDDGGLWGLDARPANPSCVAAARPQVASGVNVTRAFPNLTFNQPILLLQPTGEANRIFVVERPGRIVTIPNNDAAVTGDVKTFVDFTSKVDTNGEGGLLGVAFHPNWGAGTREVFVSYTETGSGPNPLRSVIARLKSADNGLTLDPASEERLLLLDQPFTNHDGGCIRFGPDGLLYIGFGDGGSGGDPLGSGQRLNTLLGKMLRLDVNVPFAQKYGIPSTNPFATSGAPCNLTASAYTNTTVAKCAEIFAWGFRNPWRWSFDTGSGELWVGDVGQDTYEEVDLVTLGGNYGWNTREGLHCYNAATCPSAGMIDPLVEYDHSQGVSITGGHVYRGTTIPALVGRFVYGDYGSGRIWALRFNAATNAWEGEQLQDTSIAIGSFGQTLDGEIYVLDIATGQLSKLVPAGPPPVDTFPKTLSATGCVQATDATRLGASAIPFDVNAALWSDGAAKERWFAIPDGTTITVGADGDFDLPIGSVVGKTFSLGGKRIETRLLMRHSDGAWAGYSYEWNAAETDADLLPASKSRPVGAQTWFYPSRAQCFSCHTTAAGRTLGLETAQLNRPKWYATGRQRNQLSTLEGLGFFTAPLGAPAAQLPRLSELYGSDPLGARARAYLHSNCSACHRASAGRGPQDFRYSLPLSQMNACNVAPQNGDLGVADAGIIVPGSPARSITSVRVHALDVRRMPPLGSSVVDAAGVQLLDDWITSLTACTP